jgi:hypothetical protein
MYSRDPFITTLLMTLQLKIVTSGDEYIEKSRAKTLVKPKDILSLMGTELHLLNKRSNRSVVLNGTKLRSGNDLEKKTQACHHMALPTSLQYSSILRIGPISELT